jgi:Cys-rich four helix bundle protein (predicted Tat secretion target)
MDRREFLTSVAALATVVAATGVRAESHEHPAPTTGPAAAPRDPKLAAVVEAAQGCVGAGEACIRHCVDLLGQGDTSLEDCLRSVLETSAVCTSLVRVASYANAPTPTLRAYVAACARYCRDCAEVCEKHAEHHEPCKLCMEACERCAKACEALAA